MTLKEIQQLYLKTLASRSITPDPLQSEALVLLADIHMKLVKTHHQMTHQRIKHHVNKLFGLKQNPVKGVYFWGGVGRGKTLMMDVFFEHIPFKAKQRLHFHQFMRQVHKDLARLQGLKNPLRAIANEIAKHAHVVCFDEFHVDDVADALILAELVTYIYHEGVTLLFTSNIAPDDLYKNGVQRQLFTPMIARLKEHSHVLHFTQPQDYRLTILMTAGVYFSPLNIKTQECMKHEFAKLATGPIKYGHKIIIFEREIPTIALAHKMVWFDFHEICETARSAQDYLQVTELFDTFFVSHVHQMSATQDNAAKRFIHWVDVLYDAKATLVISAEVPIVSLYTGQELRHEFQRTSSRLIEMQTEQYLRS
jgi:cell division protein ZapE